MTDRNYIFPNDPQPVFFASQQRRLDGYAGPIARINVNGVEKDIYHPSEYPARYELEKLYNQTSEDGEPSMVRPGFKG